MNLDFGLGLLDAFEAQIESVVGEGQQPALEFPGPGFGSADADKARKSTGKPGQLTLLPIAVVCGHHRRDGFDDARLDFAEQGHDKGDVHALIPPARVPDRVPGCRSVSMQRVSSLPQAHLQGFAHGVDRPAHALPKRATRIVQPMVECTGQQVGDQLSE